MPNAKRLLEMARKWQKIAVLGRKRIMSTRTSGGVAAHKSSPSVASRGHLFVYSTDGKRFMIPLTYLNRNIFRELFRMSEEEFGLPNDGPITLPCDAACMEYIISLLGCRVSIDVERAVLSFIAGNYRCGSFSSLLLGNHQQQLILYGF